MLRYGFAAILLAFVAFATTKTASAQSRGYDPGVVRLGVTAGYQSGFQTAPLEGFRITENIDFRLANTESVDVYVGALLGQTFASQKLDVGPFRFSGNAFVFDAAGRISLQLQVVNSETFGFSITPYGGAGAVIVSRDGQDSETLFQIPVGVEARVHLAGGMLAILLRPFGAQLIPDGARTINGRELATQWEAGGGLELSF